MEERENPAWIEGLFNSGIYEKEYAGATSDSERAADEAEFIVSQLGLAGNHRVLDLACGTGRHAVRIAEKVESVVGYDQSARLVGNAVLDAKERNISNVDFVVGDMRDLEYENEFDAAYNFFTSWGYYSDEENIDVLERVFRALRRSGVFLLEIINRDALMRNFKPQNWQELTDGTIVIAHHKFDLATGRMRSNRTYVSGEEKKTIEIVHHIPSADELARLLARAGFSGVRVVSSPGGGEAGIDSWRIAVIGMKSA